MTRFEYGMILMSQKFKSSSILFSAVDFAFLLCAKFQHPRFTNKRIKGGTPSQTWTLTVDPSPNRVKGQQFLTTLTESYFYEIKCC